MVWNINLGIDVRKVVLDDIAPSLSLTEGREFANMMKLLADELVLRLENREKSLKAMAQSREGGRN